MKRIKMRKPQNNQASTPASTAATVPETARKLPNDPAGNIRGMEELRTSVSQNVLPFIRSSC